MVANLRSDDDKIPNHVRNFEGPYGTLTARQRRHDHLVLIAGGIGITLMRALLEDTPYPPGGATLIYRYSQDAHAVFLDELRELAERRGVRLCLLPGHRHAGRSWLPAGYPATDAEALRDLAPHIAAADVYACGPPAWLTAVRAAARRAGVRRDDLHTEEYAW